MIHGSFLFHPHPAKPFYYCYGGTLHNSDTLSTDDPALYHNDSVYIFLTVRFILPSPFLVYITLHIACNLFKISSHTLFKKCFKEKKCFLPIDKNMDLQYTLN